MPSSPPRRNYSRVAVNQNDDGADDIKSPNTRFSSIATTEECDSVKRNLGAAVAVYGGILFWYGAWTLIDDSLVAVRPSQLVLFHARDLLIGALLLIATDVYFQVGCVDGSFAPEFWGPWLSRRLAGWPTSFFVVQQARVAVALIGSVLTWHGLYSLLYELPREGSLAAALGGDVLAARLVKCCAALGVGMALLPASGTLLAVAGLPPMFSEPPKGCALGRAFVAATCCTAGQVVLWWGGYELFTSWCPGEELSGRSQICPPIDPWKSLTLLALGLAAYFGTGTFVAAAFHDDDAQTAASPVAPRRHTLVLTLRCVVVLLGAIAHNTGVWVLVDSAFELRRRSRRGCYWRGTHEEWPCFVPSLLLTLLGYLLLLLSRSAAGNVGVYDLTPTPVLRVSARGGGEGGRERRPSNPAVVVAAPPLARKLEKHERKLARALEAKAAAAAANGGAAPHAPAVEAAAAEAAASLPVLETPRSTGSIGRCAGLELGTTPNTGRGLLASAQPRGVLTVESKGDPGSRDSQV